MAWVVSYMMPEQSPSLCWTRRHQRWVTNGVLTSSRACHQVPQKADGIAAVHKRARSLGPRLRRVWAAPSCWSGHALLRLRRSRAALRLGPSGVDRCRGPRYTPERPERAVVRAARALDTTTRHQRTIAAVLDGSFKYRADTGTAVLHLGALRERSA